MWNKERFQSLEVLLGEVTFSYLFKNCREGIIWVFTGVYCRGNKKGRDLLWKELYVCKQKWSGN